MERVRYIQAADLHLDTPFHGISGLPGAGAALREATFAALDNLAVVCEQEKPDFVLLAGDIYNQEERSIRAQLAMRNFCARMARHDIQVFIAHGNHDPLGSRLSAIAWPTNTTIFSAEPQTGAVKKGTAVLALVHGISHATNPEARNLARLLKRDQTADCFQIGLLHCNVDGAASADRYAPCSLADLLDSGLDAWALGHVHAGRILNEQPFIAYSGSTQGLDPSETGPKGCYLVEADYRDGVWHFKSRFIELGPVRWQESEIDLKDITTLDALAEAMKDCIEAARAPDRNVILTIRLTGRTALDKELRKPEAAADLMGEISGYGAGQPVVWVRRLEIATHPAMDQADLLDRDDLLGQTSRLARELRSSPEALAELAKTAFAPLYGRKRHGEWPAKPDDMDLLVLLDRAVALCQDALERR